VGEFVEPKTVYKCCAVGQRCRYI